VITQLDRSIYLASRSPRRRELLAQIGVRFQVLMFRDTPEADPEMDESPLAGEAPRAYVERVARAKAAAGWKRLEQRNLPRAAVLAADTTVAVDERILGKPADRREAADMLAALSGRRHDVLTAVAVQYAEAMECVVSRSTVEFRPLSGEDIRQYVATGECDDKAGAYAIQGRAAQFVVELRGSFSGVMGLPLYETAQLLERVDSRLAARRERRAGPA
jgi:septum formation protein